MDLPSCKAAVTSASAWLVAQAITGCKLLAVPFSQRALPSLDSCYFCMLSRAAPRVQICFPQGARCVSIQVQSTAGLEPFSPFLQREEPLLGVAVLCCRGLTSPRVGFRAFAFQNVRGKGEPTRAHSSVPGRRLKVHGAVPERRNTSPELLGSKLSDFLPVTSNEDEVYFKETASSCVVVICRALHHPCVSLLPRLVLATRTASSLRRSPLVFSGVEQAALAKSMETTCI